MYVFTIFCSELVSTVVKLYLSLLIPDDFTKQSTGVLLFHSLKNPSFPDYIFETKSGILCLDVHPEHPYLVCVGFYDGSVGVFSVTESSKGPVYQSTAKTG